MVFKQTEWWHRRSWWRYDCDPKSDQLHLPHLHTWKWRNQWKIKHMATPMKQQPLLAWLSRSTKGRKSPVAWKLAVATQMWECLMSARIRYWEGWLRATTRKALPIWLRNPCRQLRSLPPTPVICREWCLSKYFDWLCSTL